MGQLLHGCATTTETVRRAIQRSQASIRTLAKQYGINPKTVAKWKRRDQVQDTPMGSKATRCVGGAGCNDAVCSKPEYGGFGLWFTARCGTAGYAVAVGIACVVEPTYCPSEVMAPFALRH